VADATTLIPFVDAVIIVAMAGKTTEPQLRQAVNICRGLDAEILGLVLNNIHEAAPDQVLDEYNYYYD
jgi:Mrp family chromosome partitioning ATPase